MIDKLPFHILSSKKISSNLKRKSIKFSEFQITIEATHHGPTALKKPSIFIEIGTTEKQWTDNSLCVLSCYNCSSVMKKSCKRIPVAICFGGTHYPTNLQTNC